MIMLSNNHKGSPPSRNSDSDMEAKRPDYYLEVDFTTHLSLYACGSGVQGGALVENSCSADFRSKNFFSDGHILGLMRRGIRFLSNSFTCHLTLTRSFVRLLTKELMGGSLVLDVNSVGVCSRAVRRSVRLSQVSPSTIMQLNADLTQYIVMIRPFSILFNYNRFLK
ncbi:hypothetical protein BpHYR1_035782 [Brachionus plicatilis]|uniref:Uncharacterized protein n=1 Tax=Brachionus plicatilis TaxID=10195 RepID=A0A3M7RFH5_BRAPC|nr:hypothetical protein BpHYR1_035782 [Brachionus plicatilis]